MCAAATAPAAAAPGAAVCVHKMRATHTSTGDTSTGYGDERRKDRGCGDRAKLCQPDSVPTAYSDA